ncbi:MAG: RNA polymerase sigma factor SigM [Pseudonocardia sp.]|nr:RNA polymerase sigma factor SigM [Pseudonocardia sp.]
MSVPTRCSPAAPARHPAGSAPTGSPPRTDRQLLEAHRAGDRLAFDELVRRHGDPLWSVAVRILRDPEDARDVLQEAVLAAYRAEGRFRGDASVSTWLHRIVVNRCLDALRARRGRPPSTGWPERDLPDPHDVAAALITRLTVTDALALLPVEQRVALVLVDVQGWPVEEAAAILGVPSGTVKSRCARGRRRLAPILGHLREETP